MKVPLSSSIATSFSPSSNSFSLDSYHPIPNFLLLSMIKVLRNASMKVIKFSLTQGVALKSEKLTFLEATTICAFPDTSRVSSIMIEYNLDFSTFYKICSCTSIYSVQLTTDFERTCWSMLYSSWFNFEWFLNFKLSASTTLNRNTVQKLPSLWFRGILGSNIPPIITHRNICLPRWLFLQLELNFRCFLVLSTYHLRPKYYRCFERGIIEIFQKIFTSRDCIFVVLFVDVIFEITVFPYKFILRFVDGSLINWPKGTFGVFFFF